MRDTMVVPFCDLCILCHILGLALVHGNCFTVERKSFVKKVAKRWMYFAPSRFTLVILKDVDSVYYVEKCGPVNMRI
jgi:hypothetical protein